MTNKKNDQFKGMIFDPKHFDKYKELRNGASELLQYETKRKRNDDKDTFA